MTFLNALSSSRPWRIARAALLALPLGSLGLSSLGGCDLFEGDPLEDCTHYQCKNDLALSLTSRARALDAACEYGPLTVRACIGYVCGEATLSPDGECRRAADQYGLVACDEPVEYDAQGNAVPRTDTFELALGMGFGRQFGAGPHAVTVTLARASGETVYEGRQDVTLDETYPNGPECDQNPCWQAGPLTFDIDAAMPHVAGACAAKR
ncbi:MAG TPA: hypothetical protein VFS43_26900 [Polyangiaceae bacterium]|nr:hypothetical protein [Polyangiaceae bacterium]